MNELKITSRLAYDLSTRKALKYLVHSFTFLRVYGCENIKVEIFQFKINLSVNKGGIKVELHTCLCRISDQDSLFESCSVCRNLTFSKVLEFLWNPPLQLYFCFLNLLLFLGGSFGFGFGHLYGLLGLERD